MFFVFITEKVFNSRRAVEVAPAGAAS